MLEVLLIFLSFISLSLWIITQNRLKNNSIFLIAFLCVIIVYSLLIFTKTLSITLLLLHLGSLTFCLGIATVLLSNFKHNIFIQFIVLVAFVFIFKEYSEYIRKDTGSEFQMQNLVKNGEMLIEVSLLEESNILKQIKSYGLSCKRAFYPNSSGITNLDQYYIIDLPNESKFQKWYDKIKKVYGVVWIEPNEIIPFNFPKIEKTIPELITPNFSNDPSVGLQWHLKYLEIEKLYALLNSGEVLPKKQAKLYILDTGIDGKHEDLKMTENKIQDNQGHGTHCAGLVAGITNNGIGIASMMPNNSWISVHSHQVLSDFGIGTQQQIIAGIIKATDAGADVISLSLGSITNQEREKAYNDAIKYANAKGTIVVVAAGNASLDAKRYSPANSENAIVVSSINKNGEKSSFSNNVVNIKMAVAAPGENIFSTLPKNKYGMMSGTSMATPQVAGLIALMKAIKPELTTEETYTILENSGRISASIAVSGKIISPITAIKSLK